MDMEQDELVAIGEKVHELELAMICGTCKHWKVLNPHHIVNGQMVKGCACGQTPSYCRDYEKVVTKQ